MSGTSMHCGDTIVAAATPPGVGGVAVVRLSGPQAQRIGAAIAGSLPEPRVAGLRRFRDAGGAELDEGIVLFFRGPASFTGEDVVEFHCHGGPTVVAALIEAVLGEGGRRARPGEFSERAFLNDRIDLVQAEAIADLIEAGSKQAARAALRSLRGEFSRAIAALEARLIELRVFVEAAIDFPDDDIDFLDDTALAARIHACRDSYSQLLSSAATGRLLRDGFRVVIVGRPNAGKSSLMNRLSGDDTAIVTEVAGTTRDVLKERINLDGLVVEIVDTAGLREDPDRVEAEGIRRARAAIDTADAAIWVVDASSGDAATPAGLPAIPILVARNKIDLTGESAGRVDNTVNLSARSGEGIDALTAAIREIAGYHDLGEGAVSARQRHVDALRRSQARFLEGLSAFEANRAGELLAEDLRAAADELGEITGRLTSDDLLGHIFSSFCIGK